MDEAFIKQRTEKGNAEIKKMAEAHFKEREADEAKVKELEERIAKNKQVRNTTLSLNMEIGLLDGSAQKCFGIGL